MSDENNIFRELAEGMKDGTRMLNAFLGDLKATQSPQTIRSDIQAVAEILKSLGTTSERIQRLLQNDGTYMSQFEARELFRELATLVIGSIEYGLATTELDSETQRNVRNIIADEMERRRALVMEQQAEWRVSRRKQGLRATEQLTHDPTTDEDNS